MFKKYKNSGKINKKRNDSMKDLRVIFMGTPDFSVPVLEELIDKCHVVMVVTQPDKEVGRKHILTPSPIKKLALEHNIEVYQPTKIRKEYEPILNTPCDIIITCAYGQIIPESILNYPRLGCVNVHASLLPKNRGGAPIHWAIIKGEEKTGITIMYMDKGMDSGDIIKQESIDILDSDNVGTLHDKLSVLGAKLLMETLPSIIEGTNERIKQNDDEVTFSYAIKREEERIDYNKNGKDVINHIRGLNPWPLANMLVNGEEYKVLDGYFENTKSIVNKVCDVKKDAIGIGTLDGIVYITTIKPFGKKQMSVKDFLNGVEKDEIRNWKIN